MPHINLKMIWKFICVCTQMRLHLIHNSSVHIHVEVHVDLLFIVHALTDVCGQFLECQYSK
jgi:hypothetical protein